MDQTKNRMTRNNEEHGGRVNEFQRIELKFNGRTEKGDERNAGNGQRFWTSLYIYVHV